MLAPLLPLLLLLLAGAAPELGESYPAAEAEEACGGRSCAAQGPPEGLDAEDAAALLAVQRRTLVGPRKLEASSLGQTEEPPLRRCFAASPGPEVFYPGDPGYDDSRRLHNFRVAHLVIPNVTVNAKSREDVILALQCAQKAGLGALASSGMNAYEAFCTEGCVLILTAGMKNFWVHENKAMLEPGFNNGEMYYHLYKSGGFALPSGTNGIVGLGGIALGGGKGFVTRLHGLLSDRIYAVDVALYDGTVVTANEEENADLLWLCRGGGGMEIPGVVVAFYFDLIQAPNEVGRVGLSWDLDAKLRDNTVVPFLEAYQTYVVGSGDNRLHGRLEPNMFGLRTLSISVWYIGGTGDDAMHALKDFFAAPGVGEPEVEPYTLSWLNTVKETSGFCSPMCGLKGDHECLPDQALLSDYQLPSGCGYDRGFDTPIKHRGLIFEKPMDVEGLETLVTAFSNPPFGGKNPPPYEWQGFYMQMDPSNGQASKMPTDATAFPWRSPASVTLQLVIKWVDGVVDNPTWEKFSYDFIYNLSAWAEGGISYVNYLDKNIPSGLDPMFAYWGENQNKLSDVMSNYTTGTVTTTYWLTS